jgi:hypothetical protein
MTESRLCQGLVGLAQRAGIPLPSPRLLCHEQRRQDVVCRDTEPEPCRHTLPKQARPREVPTDRARTGPPGRHFGDCPADMTLRSCWHPTVERRREARSARPTSRALPPCRSTRWTHGHIRRARYPHAGLTLTNPAGTTRTVATSKPS